MIPGTQTFDPGSLQSQLSFPDGGSEMALLIRTKDWSQTGLGAIADWPAALRKAVTMALASRFPMMILWGPDAIQLYNDAFREIVDSCGRHPKALGQMARECWPETWPAIKPPVYSCMMRGEAIWMEDQALPYWPAGQQEDIRWTYSYSPIRDAAGKAGGVMLICNQTPGNISSEQQALDSKQQFKTLVEESPVATAIIRMPDMRLELANPVMLRAWGKDQRVIGQKVLEFLPELKEQGFGALFSHVFQTGKTYEEKGGQVQMNVNGVMRTAYLDYTFKALRNGAGDITSLLVTGMDVTDQVLASLQLEHTERNTRNMILQAPVPITILRSPSYIIEIANVRMLELWGRSADEVIGKPLFEAFPDIAGNAVEQRLDSVFYSGMPLSGNAHAASVRRNGKPVTIYVNYEYDALRELDGTITGVIATAVDVTDQVITREKIEAEVAERTALLTAQNEQLRKANAALEQFATMAGRTIGVPVQKIRAHCDILEKRFRWDLGQEGSQLLERIQSEAGRVQIFFEDLLSYASVPASANTGMVVHPGPIVNALLKDMNETIQAKEALVAISNLYPMKGDSLQLMLLFKHLLDNALKFSRTDLLPDITVSAGIVTGGSSGIEVSARDADRSFQLIEVTDNGIGFDPEHAEKIFGLFHRLHKPEKFPGNGIGLAITKKIVDSHNGYIVARSKPGKGATFKVLLPYEA